MKKILISVAFGLWLSFVTVTVFLILSVHRLIYFILRKDRIDLAAHQYGGTWAKIILNSIPFWKVQIDGKDNIPKQGPYVIVSNHESMADIWVMYYLGVQFRWLSKAEVFKVPAVGTAMRWAGYIPIQRGQKSSHILAMQQSEDWLRRGVPMLFFPEGTRSTTAELLPFKSGAFKLALDTKCPVLPVCISGAGKLLAKGTLVPGKAEVKMRVLPTEYAKQGESAQLFADRIRTLISKNLADLKNPI